MGGIGTMYSTQGAADEDSSSREADYVGSIC